MKFYSEVDGYVLGLRFFKGSNQLGTFNGSLWSNAGILMSTASFGPVTPSGWQKVNFLVAIKITAMTRYVISYHTSSDGSVLL